MAIFYVQKSVGGLNRSKFNQESIDDVGFIIGCWINMKKVIANFLFWPDYGVILLGKMSHLKIG